MGYVSDCEDKFMIRFKAVQRLIKKCSKNNSFINFKNIF